jgi:hypothetical protein
MPANTLEALQIAGVSQQTALSGTAAAIAIPLNYDGEKPRFVAVSNTGTGVGYIRPGQGDADTAPVALTTLTGFAIAQYGVIGIINVAGCTHIGQIGTGTGFLSVTPLANQ